MNNASCAGDNSHLRPHHHRATRCPKQKKTSTHNPKPQNNHQPSPSRLPAGGGSLLEYKGSLSGGYIHATKSQTEELYNDFITLFTDALGSSLADYKFTNEYKTNSGDGYDWCG